MSNLLPYAYARDFGLLARPGAVDGAPVDVLVAASTAPAAIAEVSRRFGQIQLTVLPRGELDAAIAGAYAGGGGDASQMADEFDADLDLTKLLQDVPAHSPALEQEDGDKWTAAHVWQPARRKSVSLLVWREDRRYPPAVSALAEQVQGALHQRQDRLVHQRQRCRNTNQAHHQRDWKADGIDVHLRRHARDHAQRQVDE